MDRQDLCVRQGQDQMDRQGRDDGDTGQSLCSDAVCKLP